MHIVIGLGNPGSAHERDRHNIGFQVLDTLAVREGLSWEHKKIFHADSTQFGELMLVKPDTFVNESGITAAALAKQYPDASVTVVYDEINISVGQIKCSIGRGDGGHNGLTSIIAHLGHRDFFRIRVGIRPVHDELLPKIAPPHGFETFVLAPFAPQEEALKEQGIARAIEAIESLEKHSLSELMNTYNS
ncbi:MAG TPA: aminoacyl-tRNA hydrolase [Candidatus Paceibacterota bacterium]|nr:aminoacyl-tRNA hydrolase [Candidatus Paceibacterota bacterium]